jgi:hypothetical protein
MTDFPVYDTTGICRECNREYPAKCFAIRTGDNPIRGFCLECQGADDARLARLKQPPKDHGIKTPRAEPEQRRQVRRSTTQRRWEPND